MATEEATQVANPFQAPAKLGGLVSIEQQRAIAQVQAAMIVARSMPRDVAKVREQIVQDCGDANLAEEAEYEYSRGGSKISGPSIRLLEALARRWGNMESGIKELSRRDGYSECEAYAWDMESNFRDSKTFQVKHWRDKGDSGKEGYALVAERDIYEVIANQGARRKRACMEAIIPNDIVDAALRQCQVTLKTKVDITPEFISGMLDNFSKFGITKEMIEKKIQRHITTLTPGLAVQLKRIYNSLKDGMAQPSDFFDGAQSGSAEPTKTGPAGLKDALRKPDSDLGGPPSFQALMKMIDRALEADKEVGLLQLEDVEQSLTALSGEELTSAKKALEEARAKMKDKKAEPKKK